MQSLNKLARLAALAVALPLSASLVAAPAYASTAGGCGIVEDGGEACISAAGADIVADFYVTDRPSACIGVELYVVDETQSTFFYKYLKGCSNGHYGWYGSTPNADGLKAFPGTNGHWYHSQLTFFSGDGDVTASSNPLQFSN